MDIPPTLIYTIALGLVALGAAWGGAIMTQRHHARRIDAVDAAHDADTAELRNAIKELATAHNEHRHEVADRLGRIEEKLDHIIRSKS
jgi:hypothetical protein